MQNSNPSTTEPNDRPMVVAVIGVGTMGGAVARRLIAAGFTVRVWDRNSRAAAILAADGATALADPTDTVTGAQVVLTWLPTAEAVSDVMIGRGVLETMDAHAIWAQMGTIGVPGTESLNDHVLIRRPDVSFVDAPVSGSRLPAESGQLLVLASGPDRARELLTPVFEAIGRRTLWLGKAGTGSRLKLVLNTWLAFEIEAASEAAAVASRLGVTPEAVAEAAEGNPLASTLALAKLTKINASDLSPEFALGWALKDLDLMDASVGAAPAPIAHAIAERWRRLVDDGFGALDVSAAAIGLATLSATTEAGTARIAETNPS